MEPIPQKETKIKKRTAVARLSRSMCMQIMFECLPRQVLFLFMLISRRCYHGFIPPVITALSIFAPKLLRIFSNSSCVEIFSHTCLAWGRIIVAQPTIPCSLPVNTSKEKTRQSLLIPRSRNSATPDLSSLEETLTVHAWWPAGTQWREALSSSSSTPHHSQKNLS